MPDAIIATNKAVFLDIENLWVSDTQSGPDTIPILLTTNMLQGLKQLMTAGYQLIVVTARLQEATEITDQALLREEQQLDEILAKNGIELSGYYYYPAGETGSQREILKSRQSLFLEAAKAHRFDLSVSWLISTSPKALKAGKMAGCKTLLLETATGEHTRQEPKNGLTADWTAATMEETVAHIFKT